MASTWTRTQNPRTSRRPVHPNHDDWDNDTLVCPCMIMRFHDAMKWRATFVSIFIVPLIPDLIFCLTHIKRIYPRQQLLVSCVTVSEAKAKAEATVLSAIRLLGYGAHRRYGRRPNLPNHTTKNEGQINHYPIELNTNKRSCCHAKCSEECPPLGFLLNPAWRASTTSVA